MPLTEVLDDHMLARYRALTDAEDSAFDELEHAYEDGDRPHFEADLSAWLEAIQHRVAFLTSLGIEVPENATP